jgi:hypothetical protein
MGDVDYPPRHRHRGNAATRRAGPWRGFRAPQNFVASFVVTSDHACDGADASVTVRAMQKFRGSISGSGLIVARLATNAISR